MGMHLDGDPDDFCDRSYIIIVDHMLQGPVNERLRNKESWILLSALERMLSQTE